jgi:predicted RNase H-like nuclease (RuvC/YqgF family)
MARAFSSSQGISTEQSVTDSKASQDDASRFDIQDRIISTDESDTTDTQDEAEENDTVENEESANESEDTTQEETQETSEGTQTVVDTKKELETWKSRYENANRKIGQQGTELHQLRQMVTQLQQQFEAKNNPQDESKFLDEFIKNPKQALAEEIQRRELQKTSQNVEQQRLEQQNIDYIYQHVPDFDSLKNDILEVAKEDGISNADMKMLEISMRTDPLIVVQFSKRAKLLKELRDTKQKGQSTLKKIASNSRKTQPIANVPNQSPKTLNDKELSSLSDAEFKALLKKYNM